MKKLTTEELVQVRDMDLPALYTRFALLKQIPSLHKISTLKAAAALADIGYTNEELDALKMHWHSSGGLLPNGRHYEFLRDQVERNGDEYSYLNKSSEIKKTGKDLASSLKVQLILHLTIFG